MRKHKKRVTTKKSYSKGRVYMARRYSYRPRRRFYGRSFRRYGRRFGGGIKGYLPPIIGGIADAVIDPRLPIDGIGSTAVGFVMHDSIVKTIGLYKVGQSIAQFIPFIGGGAASGGGQSQI